LATKELAAVSGQHFTLPFHKGIFFTKNNMNVVPNPSNFFVSLIEDKNERPPF
jgi:hypothetical protein